MSNKTDLHEFIGNQDAGLLEAKLVDALQTVALNVVNNERQGEVNLKLKLKKISNSHMVEVKATLDFKRPTARGTQSEDTFCLTPFYVGAGGKLTFYPDNQQSFLTEKTED